MRRVRPDEIERDRAVEDLDAAAQQRREQHPVHLGPGRVVPRVHDPTVAVPALKPQFPRLEPRAEPGEPVDRRGRPGRERRHDLRLAQPRPGRQRVADMRGRAVLGPDRRRQPALRQRASPRRPGPWSPRPPAIRTRRPSAPPKSRPPRTPRPPGPRPAATVPAQLEAHQSQESHQARKSPIRLRAPLPGRRVGQIVDRCVHRAVYNGPLSSNHARGTVHHALRRPSSRARGDRGHGRAGGDHGLDDAAGGGRAGPVAIMASTARRARAATSGATCTSAGPSRRHRSSADGVIIFM